MPFRPHPDRQAELDEIHRVRGQFISFVGSIDAELAICLTWWFEIQDTRELFETVILGNLSTPAKLQAAKAIAEEAGVSHEFADLFRVCTSAIDLRNRVAHSHIDIDVDTLVEAGRDQFVSRLVGGDWSWIGTRTTRQRQVKERIESDLSELLGAAEFVEQELFRLRICFLGRGLEQGAAITLTKFDEMNSDHYVSLPKTF